MTYWIRLAAPAALVATVAAPAYAVQYLSVAQAQKLAFPSATNFTSMDSRAWKAEAGGSTLGLFVVDHVIGKHLYIDYAVALDTGGRIKRVDILQTGNLSATRCGRQAGLPNSSERGAAARSRSVRTSATYRAPRSRRCTSPKA